MGRKEGDGYLKSLKPDKQRGKSPKVCEDCGEIPLNIIRYRNKLWLCPDCRNERCGLEKNN